MATLNRDTTYYIYYIELTLNMQVEKTRNASILPSSRRKEIPDGIWAKCPECGEIIYNGELDRNLRICPKCNHYFPLEPAGRINLLVDEGSFHKYDEIDCPDKRSCDPVILTGEAELSKHSVVIMVVNLNFVNTATGLFVCEKIVNAVSRAVDRRLPLLSVCTIGSGKQIQDGIFFPAQTLSISAAMSSLDAVKSAYISVLSQTSANGSFPSFAYAADIVIAESNIFGTSHTGSRIGRKEADRAIQALFQKGMIDMIVSRGDLKQNLTNVLSFLC